MAGSGEKIRGYANEFIGVAKQLFGEVLGSQKTFDEGANRRAQGETQVQWGKAKDKAAETPKDPLDDMR